MKNASIKLGLGVIAAAAASTVSAGTEPWFNPLTESATVVPPNDMKEIESPWTAPAGIAQRNLTSMDEVEADVNQSIQRVPGLGSNAAMFDMLAFDPSGRYVFIPHETSVGAGISRYDIENDHSDLLFAGSLDGATGDWSRDFGAFDPARWTPNGTVIAAEEWSGLGRVVELMGPMADAPADATALEEGEDYRVLNSIAKVAHEGIDFSKKFDNKVIYFVDEWNSGSIYKLVLKQKGDYAGGGQTFVLSVDDFAATGGVASDYWNEQAAGVSRFGSATWVPVTDKNGNPLPGLSDPFRDGPTNDPRTNDDTRGGRVVADEVGGTPYGRPEDIEVGRLPNGHEIVYVATTSEQSVISIELFGGPYDDKAYVRQFASEFETPKNEGFPATSGQMNSPDNLAQDALGNIYIIEDAPNGSSTGGDVWFARDVDSDGRAESLDHFMSIRVNGSEATGMIFNPVRPSQFLIVAQHPSSTDLANVPDGFGDAIWEFDLADVVPPKCDDFTGRGKIYNWHRKSWVKTCSDFRDFNFVRILDWAGTPRKTRGGWWRR